MVVRLIARPAGALADQSLAHAVQGLQVELIGGFRGDELHSRALHRLGDGLGITEARRSGTAVVSTNAFAAKRDSYPAQLRRSRVDACLYKPIWGREVKALNPRKRKGPDPKLVFHGQLRAVLQLSVEI
jgi:hypothetical protein